MKLLRHSCELCNAEAAVYCTSDVAFLCWTCDRKVHDDNFLVARHVRQPICSNCKIFTGDSISGVAFQPFSATCPSCPAISDDSLSSSTSSSACISSTTTNPEKRDHNSRGFDSNSSSLINSQKSRRKAKVAEMDYLKAEAIFVNWCGKLGVVGVDVAVRMACSALRVLCLERWKVVLPFRVSLAASMWLGLRLAGDKSVLTWQTLKRLEEVSGVPEKLILAAETKLEKALRRGREQQQRRRLELEEGWAEC